jgi:hypothetical protein
MASMYAWSTGTRDDVVFVASPSSALSLPPHPCYCEGDGSE